MSEGTQGIPAEPGNPVGPCLRPVPIDKYGRVEGTQSEPSLGHRLKGAAAANLPPFV